MANSLIKTLVLEGDEQVIISTDFTIAYKCIACGTFEFISVNLFRLLRQKNIKEHCRCGQAQAEIRHLEDRISILVPCIACGTNHEYIVSINELSQKKIINFICEYTGVEHCFVGNDYSVRECVDSLEREMDSMMDTLGYESYFANSQVMLETINRIHDLAESKRLICQCGCKEVTINLYYKGVFLRCSRCPSYKFIAAASNMDLKITLAKKNIVLTDKKTKVFAPI